MLQREAPPLEGEPEVVLDPDFEADAAAGAEWEPEGEAGTDPEGPVANPHDPERAP